MCMFSNINISTQCVQCVLLILVLAVNSALFCILCSYTLLLKSPVLMHPWMMYSFHISDSQIPPAVVKTMSWVFVIIVQTYCN